MKRKVTELTVGSALGWRACWSFSLRYDWVTSTRWCAFPEWELPMEYEVVFSHATGNRLVTGTAIIDMPEGKLVSQDRVLKAVKEVLCVIQPYFTAGLAPMVLTHALGCLVSAALRGDEQLACAGRTAQNICGNDDKGWTMVVRGVVRAEQRSSRS